jgi:hypothetical protein
LELGGFVVSVAEPPLPPHAAKDSAHMASKLVSRFLAFVCNLVFLMSMRGPC